MSEPLSDERLEEMRQFLSWQPSFPGPNSVHELLVTYTRELISEVTRLRAVEEALQQEIATTSESLSAAYDELVARTRQVTAMRPIVEAVAELTPGDWPVRHLELSNELVTKARALLAKEE